MRNKQIALTLDPETLAKFEEVRRQQPDYLSQAAFARRLIKQALVSVATNMSVLSKFYKDKM